MIDYKYSQNKILKINVARNWITIVLQNDIKIEIIISNNKKIV